MNWENGSYTCRVGSQMDILLANYADSPWFRPSFRRFKIMRGCEASCDYRLDISPCEDTRGGPLGTFLRGEPKTGIDDEQHIVNASPSGVYAGARTTDIAICSSGLGFLPEADPADRAVGSAQQLTTEPPSPRRGDAISSRGSGRRSWGKRVI